MSLSIFITGGTSGIGLSLAKLYLSHGYRVGISGREIQKVPSDMKTEKLNIYQVCVTDVQGMEETISDFSKDGLDIVVANAGISDADKSRRPNFIKGREIIQTNIIGVINTFSPAVDYFLENKKKGHLVAIASVAGYIGLPGASSYSASKSAVIKLCEGLSIDFKKSDIDISCLCPGFIDTPLTQQNHHPMPFLMNKEKGAKIIKLAIDKKKRLYLFPWQMKYVIIFLSIIPRSLYRAIMNLDFANYSKEK